MLVSLLLGEFAKLKQALNFYTSEADLMMGCTKPPPCSCSWRQPLALRFVFTGVIFWKSQVMARFGLNYKIYSLNMKTKQQQRRSKQYPFFQKQQKKTLSFQTLWCEEGMCRSRFHLGSDTLRVLAKSSGTRACNSKRILKKKKKKLACLTISTNFFHYQMLHSCDSMKRCHRNDDTRHYSAAR